MPVSVSRRPGGRRSAEVLVVDDHPALRAGLEGLLAEEHDLECIGAVASERELHAVLERRRPDVVLLDYALLQGDGLSACFRAKQRPHPPGVVLYSAYVDRPFAVPAALAQADGIVSKAAPVDELLTTIRRVAAGEVCMPRLDRDAMEAASSRLGADDLPVAGMLLSRVTVEGIAETLGVHPGDIRSRALRIIRDLQARDRIGGRDRTAEPERSLR